MTLDEAMQILRAIPEYSWLLDTGQQFYSTGEVAHAMNLNQGTTRAWCEKGLIRGATNYGDKLGCRMPRSGLILFFAERVRGTNSATAAS